MFPVLLQIGSLYISSLGFLSFLGFLFGGFVLWRKAKEENFDEEPVLDLWIVSLFLGFLGARFFYCLTVPTFWIKPFFGFFSFVGLPGFSFFGFLFGALAAWVFMSKKNKWDFWRFSDTAIFALLIFQVFWRLGQFLDGSFLGKETVFPWGLRFSGVDGLRHPIQIYEILVLIFLYWLLLKLERRYRLFSWYQDKRGEARFGFLLLAYFLFYGLWRLLLEFLHESSLYFEGISLEQFLSVGLICGAVMGFWVRSGKELKINLAFLPKKKEKLKPLVPLETGFKRKQKNIKKFKHIKTGIDVKE